jgi:hypothetical protein
MAMHTKKRKESSFSEEKEAKRLLCPGGCAAHVRNGQGA